MIYLHNLRTLGRYFNCLTMLYVLLASSACPQNVHAAETFDVALERLRSVSEGSGSQSSVKANWDVVSGADVAQLITILEAMKDVGPLAENWLRAAVDKI
ncbi:MAG: hypothetical protein KDA57_10660, partial [Planctomycetales bacterium]|nr:hypothetical protein [Planctomycetales bacterium]